LGGLFWVIVVLNFPVPYVEELLYSTLARAGVRQGLISPKQLLDEVFESRGVIATLDLPNHLSTVSRWLPKAFTPEKLLYRHTLFPIYAPFVPEDRRQQCMNWMFGEAQGSVHLALGVAASRIKTPRRIRYCPACLAAQKAQHGEYFWLRAWQVAGIEACPEHGALIDTRLTRPATGRHQFIAASPEYCPMTRQLQGVPASAWISCQVQHLLDSPAQPSPSFAQWTRYYHHLAYRLGFNRGKAQIDYLSIRERVLQVWPTAWLVRYNLLPNGSDGSDSDWLRSIFRKHRKSFSYLQHIVVHQALLGDGWQIGDVLEDVCQYSEDHCRAKISVNATNHQHPSPDQTAWLGLLLSYSPKQAREAFPALYARLYRNHRGWLLEVNRLHSAPRLGNRMHRVDWHQRDLASLTILQQLSVFLNANNKGPRRSRACYLKMLHNPSTVEKNLHRMPLTSTFLSTHEESVAQYQIRRLQNAYAELRTLFDLPLRWRLLRKAKLSDERLTGSAKMYLDELLNIRYEIQRCSK